MSCAVVRILPPSITTPNPRRLTGAFLLHGLKKSYSWFVEFTRTTESFRDSGTGWSFGVAREVTGSGFEATRVTMVASRSRGAAKRHFMAQSRPRGSLRAARCNWTLFEHALRQRRRSPGRRAGCYRET